MLVGVFMEDVMMVGVVMASLMVGVVKELWYGVGGDGSCDRCGDGMYDGRCSDCRCDRCGDCRCMDGRYSGFW